MSSTPSQSAPVFRFGKLETVCVRSQVTSSLLWLRQRQAHQALPTCPAPMLPALPEPVYGLRQRLADLEAQLAAAGQGRAEPPQVASAPGGTVQRVQQGRLGSAGQSAAAGDAWAAERAAAAALAAAEQQLGECQRKSGATRDMVAKQAAAAASAEDAKAAALAEARFSAAHSSCACTASTLIKWGQTYQAQAWDCPPRCTAAMDSNCGTADMAHMHAGCRRAPARAGGPARLPGERSRGSRAPGGSGG